MHMLKDPSTTFGVTGEIGLRMVAWHFYLCLSAFICGLFYSAFSVLSAVSFYPFFQSLFRRSYSKGKVVIPATPQGGLSRFAIHLQAGIHGFFTLCLCGLYVLNL